MLMRLVSCQIVPWHFVRGWYMDSTFVDGGQTQVWYGEDARIILWFTLSELAAIVFEEWN